MSKKMLNKVSKKDVIDAIEYFWKMGYITEMSGDKKYYTMVLLKKVANFYNIKLEGDDKEERWQDV